MSRDSGTTTDVETGLMASTNGHAKVKDGRKKVLVVGAGAAGKKKCLNTVRRAYILTSLGMSTAHHLSQHPDKFDVTLIDSNNYCGGQAFSVSIDKNKHGASWFNQGVQGGSYIFHHTLTMFSRQGYHSDPVKLQVSFGKDDNFWTNVFPTKLLERHQSEIHRFCTMLKIMRWFEVIFALIPLKIILKLFWFSEEFANSVALPMTALFLGTGNYTPETPGIMLERLCTSPTYGMWYPPDKISIASNLPPMVVFPNFTEFYTTWQKDIEGRGVHVRLSTGLVQVLNRDKSSVVVSLQKRTPGNFSGEGPYDADIDGEPFEEQYDELVLCCLADVSKKVLGKTASGLEKRILGSTKWANDITITHYDSDYIRKHYDSFYRPDQAVSTLSRVDQTTRNIFAKQNFRPMYYIKMYPEDRTKLEMCFDCTNYQSQFPQEVPFDNHVFQTIFLNHERDGHLWSRDEIDKSKIIREDWWHQLCHSYTHYIFTVPWQMFVQGKRSVRYAAAWTLVNAHEVAIISGIAAAVDLGAEYPEDLENDKFALLSFRLYYLLVYGKWYRRKYKNSKSESAKQGRSWATGLYGGVYQGPGVSKEERTAWREDMKSGLSIDNMVKDKDQTPLLSGGPEGTTFVE